MDRPQPRTVRVTYRRQTFEVPAGITLQAAIRRCQLDPESMLAVVNGTLVREDVVLRAGDRVRLVPAISGG